MRWPYRYTLDAGAAYPAPCDPYFTEGWLGEPTACGDLGQYADRCTYTVIDGWEIFIDVVYGWRTQECR
jgi:hypothetical protein